MKVFLDTNVVIDYLAKREPFFEDAERIFLLAENPAYELCISALSFTNIAYILRKHTSSIQLLGLIESLLELMTVLPTDRDVIEEALHAGFSDFEDAVQHFTAKRYGADAIITRDKTGFAQSALPVFHPSEWQ